MSGIVQLCFSRRSSRLRYTSASARSWTNVTPHLIKRPWPVTCVKLAELSGEFDRALQAQRREFAEQLQTLKERLGDVASRPSSDQSQIERAAAAPAETAVARLRVGRKARAE